MTYWIERGKVYERDFRPERYRDQEAALVAALRPLPFRTVLDVGCGFGRIGQLLTELRPDVDYTGIDISEEQLTAARRRLGPKARLVTGDIRALPTRKYDLVLAIEVLMHLPPSDIGPVAATLRRLARGHLVTLDWEAPGSEAGGYCWGHDYAALFPGASRTVVGRQALWLT